MNVRYLSILLAVSSVALLGASCTPATKYATNPTNTASNQPPTVNDSTLPQALLSLVDTTPVKDLGDARPSLVELNDHLDDSIPNGYNFYVSRTWYDNASGNQVLQNSIIQFASPDSAQSAIVQLADSYTKLHNVETVGDKAVVYYLPAEDTSKAAVTYRFTMGAYAMRVQVSATDDNTTSDAAIQDKLLPIAAQVAKIQAGKLQYFLAGKLPAVAVNDAMKHLPTQLNDTHSIGAIPVTDQEWLGVTGDTDHSTISGYKTGGLSRFVLDSNKHEVVEITVLQFDTADRVHTFEQGFKDQIAAKPDTKLDLPADLAAADASSKSGYLELQAVKNNYLIDVSLFAPFDDKDQPKSEDLVKFGQEVLGKF